MPPIHNIYLVTVQYLLATCTLLWLLYCHALFDSFFTHSWSLVFLIERMEKGKVKKVKRERASLFKRRKQTTRQDARNGEDKKADPQHKEMVESDKDYLPDHSWHNKRCEAQEKSMN